MAAIRKTDIRRAAMDLLARREHTREELTQKLYRKFARRVQESESDDETDDYMDSAMDSADPAPAGNADPAAIDGDSLPEVIDREITLLAEENLQSDDRFVESFVNGRRARGHGPLRIRQELLQRQVAESLIDAYLDERDDEWLILAREVYQKKFGDTLPDSYKEKARRLRFMQQRGFALSLVDKMLTAADPE